MLVSFMQPISGKMVNGDWKTLVCYLNRLTEIKPENRAILIIRDLVSINNETVSACLDALVQKVTEGELLFPVILVTLDNKWYRFKAVRSSHTAFDRF